MCEESRNEALWIKGNQVFDLLTCRNEFNGHTQVVSDGKREPTLGGAIQFANNDACQANVFRELTRLQERVLSGRRINNNEQLMWAIGDKLLDDLVDLLAPP